MSKKIKFKVSDKLVKQRDGAGYSLSNYTEGVDYVMRGCFKGQKAVFREDILGVSVVDPSVVEHKQEPAVIAEHKSAAEILQEAGHTVRKSPLKWSDELNTWVNSQLESQPESTEPSTEEWRPSPPGNTESLSNCVTVSTDSKVQVNNFDGLLPEHCPVQECKIHKIHPNYKWVETDKGRVWVGLKGNTLRVGQVIRVKNGELFLGKTAPSSPFVRV